MARVGTTHLVPIMNDHDCLPVNNFRYGQDPRAILMGSEAFSTSSIRVMTVAGWAAPWPARTG